MSYRPTYNYIPPIKWHWQTPWYDFFCAASGLGKRFREKVLQAVAIHDGQIIADVGCGTGVFVEIAKRRYPSAHFIGIDPDRKALAIAEQALKRAGLAVELKQAFAESLPLASGSVDICFSTLAFHHMPNEIKQKAAQEIYRVLKPDGVVVIADFGESKSFFLRKMLFFEKMEYLEGNLNGLVPLYLEEAGFKTPETVGSHFPGIKLIRARK
ncbi:MAG: class I SAM-dependent methyltransferase [Patescibacteria group bacterium]